MKNFFDRYRLFFEISGLFALLGVCILLLQYNKKINVYPEDYNRAESARVNCEKIYTKDACHVFKREIVKCLDENNAFSTCITVEKDGLQRYFENHGYTGNAMIPLIMVKAYRKSGKWYNTKISPIEGEILDFINNSQGFIVSDLIRSNHVSVRHLSPLSTSFSNLQDYYFVVEVFNVNGFMDSVITR